MALGVGSKFAWRHLEKLLRRDGALSESDLVVKHALQAVGSADPAELRQLAVAVRSGDRQRAGRSINKLLELAIVEEADEADSADRWREAAEPVPQARIEDAEAAESQPQAVEIHAVAARAGGRQRRQGRPRTVAARGAHRCRSERRRDCPACRCGRPRRVIDPDRPTCRCRRHRRNRRRVGRWRGGSCREGATSPTEAPKGGSAPADLTGVGGNRDTVAVHDALLVSQGTPGSVVDELAILRSLGGHGTAAFGRRERAELLASLGRDWTRRRALSRMIQSHAVADVSEALQLVELIESPSQRAWCLADVLALWELTESDRRRVLDAVPSEGARRRLAKRSARG